MKKSSNVCIFCAPAPCECGPKKKTPKKRTPKPAGGVEAGLAATAPPPAVPKLDVRAAMRQAAKVEEVEHDEEFLIALANLSPILAPSEREKYRQELNTPLARKIRWRNNHANPA